LTPDWCSNRTRAETGIVSACLLHCLHTVVPGTVPAFAICTHTLLLTAAVCQSACKPVSDDLFLVDRTSIAQAGATASTPVADVPEGTEDQPIAGSSSVVMVTEQTGKGARPKPNSTINFNWTESIPGAGGCQPAMFTGRFFCQVATLTGVPDQLNGVINVVLHGSSETQTLNIDGGQITVYDDNMVRIVIAPVSGGLECGNQRLKASIDATPTDAMPVERQISWVNLNVQPITTGTLTGSLDPDLQQITGDLEINFAPTTRCVGEFSIKAWAFE
jgi:hypothetical protein